MTPLHTVWPVVSPITTRLYGDPVISQSASLHLAGTATGEGSATGNITLTDSRVYLPTVTTAPAGVFGMAKLMPTYSGPAITVRRSSDNATQDIGFAGQGLNTAAALAFAGAGTLYVTRLYNQDGSGKDLTQTVAASQPQLRLEGSQPALVINAASGTQAWLNIPTTITADRQNCTLLAVAADQHQAVDEGLFAMGVTGTIDLGLSGQPVSSNSAQVFADGSKIAVSSANGSTVSTASRSILGLVSASSGITLHRDGTTATSAALSSRAMVSGGFLGKSSTNGKAHIFAFVIYPAALGTSDINAVKVALKAVHKTNTTSGAYNISMFGDSKTYGVETPNNRTITWLLSELYNNPAYIFRNRAISGSMLNGSTTNYAANKGIEADGTNILILSKGTNDVSNVGNRTAAQLWTDFQATIASARAAGYTRFVGVTLTSRTVGGSFTAAMEAERVAFNARMIANDGGLFDAVANYNTLSQLGTDGAPNLTYLPDGLHETEAAYALEAPVLKAAIDTAIAAALKPSCTTTPTLTGSVIVGGVASCASGTWGNSPTAYSYQWFYADTLADITGANASTRTLISADVGHTLACRVTASNANGSATTKTLPTVTIASTALGISGTPGIATQSTAYSFTPVTVGGTTPYSYAVTAGALPAGLSLNASTGAISGTPTGTGTASLTITVTDATATTAALVTSITVNAAATALLDSLAATPVAAFSTTKIRSAYAGPVIKAWRDGDNAVGDVAFDGTGVLSATSVITITAAGTSAYTVGQTMAFSAFYAGVTVRVGTWYDQSGNGRSFSQATQSAMPVIVSAGTLAVKNGVATVDFSASTSYALPTSTINGVPAGNSFAVSAVMSRENTNAHTLLSPSAAGGVEFILDNAAIKLQKAFSGAYLSSTATPALSTLAAVFASWDGTNYAFTMGGSAAGSGTSTATTFIGTTTLKMAAGTNFVRGKVSELIIFHTSVPSSGDQTAIHTSQAARFAVA